MNLGCRPGQPPRSAGIDPQPRSQWVNQLILSQNSKLSNSNVKYYKKQ